jgi:hypothetical protein
MDGAGTKGRNFPGYTTDELKIAVMDYLLGIHPCGEAPAGHVEALKTEIARREAGLSIVYKVPQL